MTGRHPRRLDLASAAAALLLCAARPAAAEPVDAQFTLGEALAAAEAAFDGSEPVQSARHSASAAVAGGAAPPSLGLVTSVSAEPQAGQPSQLTAREQLTFDILPASARAAAFGSARAQIAQTAAALAVARRAKIHDVVEAFFEVAADQARAESAAEAVALAKRTAAAATQRRQTGAAPQIDVERAEVALYSAAASLEQAQAALAADRLTLLAAAGLKTDIRRAVLPALPAALPDLPATLSAVEASPDLAAGAAAVGAARALLWQARAQLEPSVSLGAGLQVTRISPQSSLGPSLSLGFNVPLPNSAQRASIAAARAALDAAKLELSRTREGLTREILQTRGKAESLMAKLADLQLAFDGAQRVADAELAAYKLGAVSSADLVASLAQLAAARSALSETKVAAAQAAAELDLLMGKLPS